mmetsp:Transcript_108785/g.318269  ORF Transcript_108785/g.318269 Transcript_108785/m.318269 type:complete len:509 (-) Transcript_108785:143-1669(-)
MDDLVPNPDACQRFDPNQFKKEKCKNCGRPWTEHKGVITEEQILTFVKQKQKIIDDQRSKEAEAREKARAKAIAKKKQNQAVEDKWLYDGSEDLETMQGDSDDDQGFQMLRPGEFKEALLDRPKVDNKPLKVVNLIDFSACDVYEDRSSDGGGSAVASRSVEPEPALPGCPAQSGLPFRQGSSGEQGASTNGSPDAGGAALESVTPARSVFMPTEQREEGLQEELLSEIEHLRQMLADANEEKNIQVAIVQDEVVEKQQLLDELKRQRVEMEAQLRVALEDLAAAEARAARAAGEREEARALAEKRRAEAELRCAETQELRAQAEQQRMEIAQLQALARAPAGAAPSRSQVSPSVASLFMELRELCSRTQELLGDGGAERPRAPAAQDIADVGELEAVLQSLRDMVLANHAAAQHASAERRHLAVKLRDLEKASTLAKRGISSEPPPARSGAAASEEAHVVAQEMGRQAAQAIKELRLNAEQHLAWINKRMRKSHQEAAAPPPGAHLS